MSYTSSNIEFDCPNCRGQKVLLEKEGGMDIKLRQMRYYKSEKYYFIKGCDNCQVNLNKLKKLFVKQGYFRTHELKVAV